MTPLQIALNLIAALIVFCATAFSVGYLEGQHAARKQPLESKRLNCPPDSVDTGKSCVPRYGLDPFQI